MSLRCASVGSPTASYIYIRVSGLYTRVVHAGAPSSRLRGCACALQYAPLPTLCHLSAVERGQLTVTGKGRPEAGTHLDPRGSLAYLWLRGRRPRTHSQVKTKTRLSHVGVLSTCVYGPRAAHGLGAYCHFAQDASISVCPAKAAVGAEEATSGQSART